MHSRNWAWVRSIFHRTIKHPSEFCPKHPFFGHGSDRLVAFSAKSERQAVLNRFPRPSADVTVSMLDDFSYKRPVKPGYSKRFV
jgi:hypothetical protein